MPFAFSRDKDEIRRLAAEGQAMARAADLIMDPLVLVFLGLDEEPRHTEDERADGPAPTR